MSDTSSPGLHAWLISDSPESRRQARLGQLYRQWLAFKRNPMAVAGLAIIVLLLYKLDKIYPNIMKDLAEREARGEM